jgi:lysophospholipase L1-like esterase
MTLEKPPTMRDRWLLVGLAVAVAAFGAWSLRSSVPRPEPGGRDAHEARAALLSTAEVAYAMFAPAVAALSALAMSALALRRRLSRRVRSALMAVVVVGSISLVGLMLAEAAAAAYLSWAHRVPRLAMADGGPRRLGTGDDATIVVVGESSAEGVPYRDWLSVGKIVAWQLRRLFPQRMFHVETQARAGWTLEQMLQKLAEPHRPPDAVILYAGHNEFASRFGWSADVPHYLDDPRPAWPLRLTHAIALRSPICRLIREARDRELVAARPPARGRPPADVPSHTAAQYRERLDDFRRRLEAIVVDLERAGVLTILVVPPGNDAGFEPSRSLLPPETPRAVREAFCREMDEARALESTDSGESVRRYRALILRQPGFAEAHFRLARRLEADGALDEAYREYALARDLDGHPMRCPTPFQDVYRELAARYGAILVDGQAVFHARHPRGLLDDSLFNDGMHPSFEGYVALAEAILEELKRHGAFRWPGAPPAPKIDLAECSGHFDVTTATWKEVCKFAAGFYRATMPIRHDPAERAAKARRYEDGLRRLEAGEPAESLGIPGVGIRPARGADSELDPAAAGS